MMTFKTKVKSLSFTLLAIAIGVTCSSVLAAKNSPDPFIKKWESHIGNKIYTLEITQNNDQSKPYKIKYTTQNTVDVIEDLCWAITDVSLNCTNKHVVTRRDKDYSILLTTPLSDITYVYYDPNHIKEGIIGDWHLTLRDTTYTISVQDKIGDKQYNVITRSEDKNGNYCNKGVNVPVVYTASNPDNDGRFTLSVGPSYMQYIFKYDPKTQQITNPYPGSNFEPGHCIHLPYSVDNIFRK